MDDITKNDEMVMKLLHFFITKQGYSPIVLHGAKDEIWLENLDNDYEIVRIVTRYIHNDEQLDYDIYRTKQIVKKIKKKTLTFKMKTLSFFLNLGDNVNKIDDKNYNYGNIDCLKLNKINDIKKYGFVLEIFPEITKNTDFKEKGMELLIKITGDINKTNEEENIKNEEIFKLKKPSITYALIFINVLIFLLMYLFGNGSEDIDTLHKFGAMVNMDVLKGEYLRLITSCFLHIGIIHLLFNMYALFILGPQIESFFGKTKFLIIYLFSGIGGNLLSMLFTGNNIITAGASGAIFGLMGAMLYFGYNYRLYLGTAIKRQIIPIIVINLLIGFSLNGINNVAHIGGLISGLFISNAVGLKYKSDKSDYVNGFITMLIYFGFLIYLIFIR